MIYMPDARRMVLTVEADPICGWVVTSSTHSLLRTSGDTVAEALAAVPGALAAVAEAQERIDAAWGPVDVHALSEHEPRGGLWRGIRACLLLSLVTWALIWGLT